MQKIRMSGQTKKSISKVSAPLEPDISEKSKERLNRQILRATKFKTVKKPLEKNANADMVDPIRKALPAKLPKAANSQKYTSDYVDAWADGKDIPNIFLYFPNLEGLLKGKRVLDIGSGSGGFVNMLRSRNIDAIGIDLFNEPKQPHQLKGDFMHYPFDKQFDVVFGMGVFEEDAIYSPQAMNFGQKEMAFKKDSLKKNYPISMLRRLNELLAPDGFGIFSIYTSQLIFSREMASEEGFRLTKYVRSINTKRYPSNPKYDAVLRPETKYVISRKK